MLSVKQGGIKYHFLSIWYDATWDWTLVSRAIGKPLYVQIICCRKKYLINKCKLFVELFTKDY